MNRLRNLHKSMRVYTNRASLYKPNMAIIGTNLKKHLIVFNFSMYEGTTSIVII